MEKFRQVRPASWVTEQMPDGSIAIFDPQSKNSYFLNARAAAAWEACREPANAASVARRMGVSVETALAALAELEAKHLVEACPLAASEAGLSDVAALAARRRMLQTIGAAAGAVVLALTAAEQKAYAFQGGSGKAG